MRKYKFSQSGFIQGFIIPAIVLLGILLGGFLWLNAGTQYDVRGDEASMDAGLILVQSSKLTAAIERAIADGIIQPATVGAVDLNATLVVTNVLPAVNFTVPPARGLTSAASWQYVQGVYRAKDAQGAPADVGSSQPDNVIFLPNVEMRVCARINNKLFNSSSVTVSGYAPGGSFATGAGITGPAAVVPALQQAGATEGCVPLDGSATNFAYYKIIGVR